jgi:5-methylcytosine-specific restriction endonuclease McrA
MWVKKRKSGVSRVVRDNYSNSSKPGGKTWYEWCAEVRKRFRGLCAECKTPENPKAGVYHEVHHIRKLSAGGTTCLLNLILLCKRCHGKRHSHMKDRH